VAYTSGCYRSWAWISATRAERSGAPSAALTTRPATEALPVGFFVVAGWSGGGAATCESKTWAAIAKEHATIKRRNMPELSMAMMLAL
jgi:hypothetical protein